LSDIFEEVDESIRQDKLEIWWKRYQFFVYGALALVIGAVAVREFVLVPQAEAARAERALALETALSELHNGSYSAAETAFSDLANGGSKLAPLAANYLAQVRYEGGGDAAGAADALAAIGGVEGGPYERVALLKKAYFKADDQSMTELEATLGSLVDDEGALGSLARELIAAKAFATGDTARARTEFNRLRFDAAAPAGVKRRAELALAAIPVADTPEAPADTGTETPETESEAPAPAPAPAESEETGQ
tara:strand:- start:769 stop:1518 length:750 start_codon:yes stop_codon:yes gene_type:complete